MKTDLASGSSLAPIYSRCGDNGYTVYIQGDGNLQFLQWIGSWQAASAGANAVAGMLGKWTHIACVFNRSVGTYGTQSIYTNGVLANAHALPGAFLNNTCGTFNLGDRAYLGGMDEVAFYDKALSAQRIVAHYQTGAKLTPSLVPYLLGGDFILSWSQGTLQSAPAVTGPWGNVSGAISPWTNGPPVGAKFFRLKL
jgi:hypothetical protein